MFQTPGSRHLRVSAPPREPIFFAPSRLRVNQIRSGILPPNSPTRIMPQKGEVQ